MIKALANSLGVMTEDLDELKTMVTDFYKSVYTSECVAGMEHVLSSVPVKVTEQMNEFLLAPYTNDEVKTTLIQMFPTNAPRPDGFPTHLYQWHWDICGEEVTKVVLRIVRGEEDADCVNDTILVFIPKVWNPTQLSQFCSISSCNVDTSPTYL